MGILKLYYEHFSGLNDALWLHDDDLGEITPEVTSNKWQFSSSLLLIPRVGTGPGPARHT